MVVVTASLLTGCSVLETVIGGPQPQTPPREPLQPPPDPEFFPDGSAEDNWPYFAHVLSEFAEGEAEVDGENVVNALADSGFDADAMQVSFDRTETGLVADSIFVSVRIGKSCLVGQIVTGDREAVAEVMPAVGPERDICLIGETRAIDWL